MRWLQTACLLRARNTTYYVADVVFIFVASFELIQCSAPRVVSRRFLSNVLQAAFVGFRICLRQSRPTHSLACSRFMRLRRRTTEHSRAQSQAGGFTTRTCGGGGRISAVVYRVFFRSSPSHMVLLDPQGATFMWVLTLVHYRCDRL